MPRKPVCPQCGAALVPGLAHKCPSVSNGGLDWKWIAGFAIQFAVLLGTMLWQGGGLKADLANLQKQVDHQQSLLDRFTGGGK